MSRRDGFLALTILVIVALDQASKVWVIDVFDGVGGIREITGFFNLVLTLNRGVSFSMFTSDAAWAPWALVAVALIAVALLTRWMRRSDEAVQAYGFALIIGGALGNVIDRVRYGGVVDFLDFHVRGWHWPAFNLADSAITLGAAAVIGHSLLAPRMPRANEEAADKKDKTT